MALALLAVSALAGCGGEAARDPASPVERSPFAYDRDAPLGFRDAGAVNRDYPIPVRDVSFASPLGGRVTAYLLVPPRPGPKPAAIYLHGAGGSRADFVVPASWLAARGAVTLAVDAPASTGEAATGLPGVRAQRDLHVRTVIELRRAVDVVASLPSVDPSRVAFFGFSAGARAGAILAGQEPRIRSFVLMSGGATPIERYAAAAPPRLRDDVEEILDIVDPLRHVGGAAPGTIFFLNGRGDTVVPRSALEALIRAAGDQRVRWYGAGHALNRLAHRDALDWLSERLRLQKPYVPGAAAGP